MLYVLDHSCSEQYREALFHYLNWFLWLTVFKFCGIVKSGNTTLHSAFATRQTTARALSRRLRVTWAICIMSCPSEDRLATLKWRAGKKRTSSPDTLSVIPAKTPLVQIYYEVLILCTFDNISTKGPLSLLFFQTFITWEQREIQQNTANEFNRYLLYLSTWHFLSYVFPFLSYASLKHMIGKKYFCHW